MVLGKNGRPKRKNRRPTDEHLRPPRPLGKNGQPLSRDLFCVKCIKVLFGIKFYHVLKQNTRVITVICNWIKPCKIRKYDFVCEECFLLAVKAVNTHLHEISDRFAGPSLYELMEVCLLCQQSLVKKQSHEKVVLVQGDEIQSSDKICHACYQRVEKRIIYNKELARTILENGLPSYEEQTEPTFDVPSIEDRNTVKEILLLEKYRRAPNNTLDSDLHRCDNIFLIYAQYAMLFEGQYL